MDRMFSYNFTISICEQVDMTLRHGRGCDYGVTVNMVRKRQAALYE